jgi:glutamine amidotransferase
MLAYLGPPVPLWELLAGPAHSLLRQSWAPRRQTHGVVNADGFGVGWYDPAVRVEPAVYRSARPMWADRNVASFGGVVRSGAVLAAVRSATPPLPVEETGAPPFTDGRFLFAHNGSVPGWLDGAAARLRRALSDRQLSRVEGATDAEVLFRLALDRIEAGASAGDALRSVVSLVGDGRLTMLLLDGVQATGITCGESLYVRRRDRADGVVVASEPYDDEEGWEQVPDGTVVELSAP